MGFGGLSIATSGLRVAQRNLNVTGHNIANSEVAGYSRQRIVQTTAFQRNIGINNANQRMQVGMGAMWSEVHQIRNEFLDINFRNRVSQLNFYSTKVQAGTSIESIMGELHGAYCYQKVINNIWYAIQELTINPSSIAARQFFMSNVTTFLTKSQDIFDGEGGLREYQMNLDEQVRELVNGRNGINATVSGIAELNYKIRSAELSGEKANDFRDERHRLLDHLATMIPIDVVEGPNGDVNISSLGHHILTGTTQSFMGLRYISNEATLVEPVFTHLTDEILSAGTPPTEFTSYLNYISPIHEAANNDNGKLLALLQARGMTVANHLSADVLPPTSPAELNRLADSVRTAIFGMTGTYQEQIEAAIAAIVALGDAATEAQLLLRQDLEAALRHSERDPHQFISRLVFAQGNLVLMSELAYEIERDFFAQSHNYRAHMWSINHAMIPQTQMNLDRIVNSVVTMINDAFTGLLRDKTGNFVFYETELAFEADGVTPRLDNQGNQVRVPVLAFDGGGNPIIDPVTGQQARIPIRPLNMNDPPGFGVPLFVRQSDITTRNPNDPNWFTWPISEHEDPNRAETIFTTTNIRINPDFLVAGGHNNLALSLCGARSNTDLLVALQGVWMEKDGHYSVLIDGNTFNIQDAYIRFTGKLATEIAEAASKVKTQTIEVDQAHNRRMAIKGVSMDEEMNAMLRFQFAFQAASRAFNVIDSMIDRLINGTGRVGM
jgi:flagellar hook-associated protein FlgK